MTKLIISVMMFTMVAVFSFADEGEQTQAPAQDGTQVQEQAQAPAPEQIQALMPDEARDEESAKKVIKEVTLRTGASGSLAGKVSSIQPADPLTRPRSKIVIVDSDGEAVEFVVKALAVVYDQTGRFLSLDDIRPEQEVRVDYIKKAGKVKEAVSIKILK